MVRERGCNCTTSFSCTRPVSFDVATAFGVSEEAWIHVRSWTQPTTSFAWTTIDQAMQAYDASSRFHGDDGDEGTSGKTQKARERAIG